MGETFGPGRNPNSVLDATEQRTDVVLTGATEGPTGELAEEARRSDGANPSTWLVKPSELGQSQGAGGRCRDVTSGDSADQLVKGLHRRGRDQEDSPMLPSATTKSGTAALGSAVQYLSRHFFAERRRRGARTSGRRELWRIPNLEETLNSLDGLRRQRSLSLASEE